LRYCSASEVLQDLNCPGERQPVAHRAGVPRGCWSPSLAGSRGHGLSRGAVPGKRASKPRIQPGAFTQPPPPLPTSPVPDGALVSIVGGCSLCMTAFQDLHVASALRGFSMAHSHAILPWEGTQF